MNDQLSLSLDEGEYLLFIECVSAGHQEPGHVGVGCPTDIKKFDANKGPTSKKINPLMTTVQTGVALTSCSKETESPIAKAQAWLSEHKDEPYLDITATLQHIEEFEDVVYRGTRYSARWKTLFNRDE